MSKDKIYRQFLENRKTASKISLEELEERIEQSAREEEADNIILAEDKRKQD